MNKVLIGAAVLLAGTAALAQVAPPPGVSQGTTPVPGAQAPQMQMRMQLQMDHYTKIMEALSNIMKKLSDTSRTFVENLK